MKIDTKDGVVSKALETGFLQGSTLSPLLFNIYTIGLHKIFESNKEIEILQYADDFAIIIQGESFSKLEANSNLYLKLLNQELIKLNLKINENKTQYQIFKYNRKIDQFNIKINDSLPIKNVKNYKYLGIYIDENLNFTEHCNFLKTNIEKRLQAVRHISGFKYGGHPVTLLNIVKALIFSKLYYGSIIYMGGIKVNINKIITLFNKSIKLGMGFTKNTPSEIIYSEAGVIPFKQVEFLSIKFIINIFTLPLNPNKNIIETYLNIPSRFKKPKSYLQQVVTKYKSEFSSIISSPDPLKLLNSFKTTI